MDCCHIQTERKAQRSWWRSVSGSAGSGALLVLLPKCPMCIAAYLTLWTGASVAMPVATHLRPLLEIVFIASALLLLTRSLTLRTHDRVPHVPILGRGKGSDGDRSKRTGYSKTRDAYPEATVLKSTRHRGPQRQVFVAGVGPSGSGDLV